MPMEQSQLEMLATAGIIAAEFGHTMPTLIMKIMTRITDAQNLKEEGQSIESDRQLEIALQIGVLTSTMMGAIESYIRSRTTNKLPYDVPYDANKALEEIVSALRETNKGKLIPKLGTGLPKIELPNGFLALCTYNALRNSLAAGAQNFEYATEAAEGFVKVSFVDDGWGIPADYLKNIVDPFESFRTGSIGFGLATTKRIMELYSGKLEIRSPVKDGRGTCVSLYLPAAKE